MEIISENGTANKLRSYLMNHGHKQEYLISEYKIGNKRVDLAILDPVTKLPTHIFEIKSNKKLKNQGISQINGIKEELTRQNINDVESYVVFPRSEDPGFEAFLITPNLNSPEENLNILSVSGSNNLEDIFYRRKSLNFEKISLKLNQTHKSIKSINEIILDSKFNIITGKNGIGKSNLLEAINKGKFIIYEQFNQSIQNQYKIYGQEISYNNYNSFDVEYNTFYDRPLDEAWNNVKQMLDNFPYLFEKYIQEHSSGGYIEDHSSLTNPHYIESICGHLGKRINDITDSELPEDHRMYLKELKKDFPIYLEFTKEHPNYQKLEELCKLKNKELLLIKKEDLKGYEHLFVWEFILRKLEAVFKDYWREIIINRMNRYYVDELNFEYDAWTKEEIIMKIEESPWNILNNIISLEFPELTYQLNNPEDTGSLEKLYNFKLKMRNTEDNSEIILQELSNGEKIIFSLITAIYRLKMGGITPKLILLDEIDAPLHPTMVKKILKILKDFSEQYGINIIMVTHSASTVAMSPENSIYVLEKNENIHNLKKVSKDSAIRVLTEGIPTLSINYENRKQVFVESNYDREFYEKIYQKLHAKGDLSNEISLNFISSGIDKTKKYEENGETHVGDGNCDQVRTVVKYLRNGGAKGIYGIIDWDLKPSGADTTYVKILGKNFRYSIENYIFDPIYLAGFLISEGLCKKSELGLEELDHYLKFESFTSEKLQNISNCLMEKIKPQFNPESEKFIKCKYCNGAEIEIPNWYLHTRGHDVETKLKNNFQRLKQYDKEGVLKRKITDRIICEMPGLISQDVLDIFKEIQKGH